MSSLAVNAVMQSFREASFNWVELATAGAVGGATAFVGLGVSSVAGLYALGAGSSVVNLLANDASQGGYHTVPEYFWTAVLGAFGGRLAGVSGLQAAQSSLYQLDGALIREAVRELGVKERLNLILGLRALSFQLGGLIISSLPVTQDASLDSLEAGTPASEN